MFRNQAVLGVLLLPGVAAVLLVPQSRAPRVDFVYQCRPAPSQTCTFASVGDPALAYSWSWGDGRKETHARSWATNTWLTRGTYTVTLVATDAAGASGSAQQQVTVPFVGGGIVHDTVQLPPIQLPAIHDTVVKHDTVYSAPPVQVPQGPGRVVVEPTPGEYLVYQAGVLLGRLVSVGGGSQWQAYQFIVGQMNMPCLGLSPTTLCNVYSSQDAARDALP